MSADSHLVIQPQADGYRYWLKQLSDIDWPVLPGTRQRVLLCCQVHSANAATVAAACLSDPLLCWLLSRRANTLISQRQKWPNHLEQLISLIGIPQVIKIVHSCTELSPRQLQLHHAVLNRTLINSTLASHFFCTIAGTLNPEWQKHYQLPSLLIRLPEWGMAISAPKMQLQLELLENSGCSAEQAQSELLDCQFHEISTAFSQQATVLPHCSKAWQWHEGNSQQHAKEALKAFRLRMQGRHEKKQCDPVFLMVACHRLVSKLWSKQDLQQSLKLLSGISGIDRARLKHLLNNSLLTMPWHESFDDNLHPMRWLHCQWQLASWLPEFQRPINNNPDTQQNAALKEGARHAGLSHVGSGHVSTNHKDSNVGQTANTASLANDTVFKQCLKRLLNPKLFNSSNHLLEFTLQSMKRGLGTEAAMIWIYNRGILKCRHFYGLKDEQTPAAFKVSTSKSDICHRLLEKSTAVKLNASHPSLSPELATLTQVDQEIALMSVLVANKPAALIMLTETQGLNEQQFRAFKQLCHGFHQALLRQLKGK